MVLKVPSSPNHSIALWICSMPSPPPFFDSLRPNSAQCAVGAGQGCEQAHVQGTQHPKWSRDSTFIEFLHIQTHVILWQKGESSAASSSPFHGFGRLGDYDGFSQMQHFRLLISQNPCITLKFKIFEWQTDFPRLLPKAVNPDFIFS